MSDWRDYDSRTVRTSASDGTTWNAAAYVDAQWFALRWLTLYAGARYDRFTTSGRIEQSAPPAFVADRYRHVRPPAARDVADAPLLAVG